MSIETTPWFHRISSVFTVEEYAPAVAALRRLWDESNTSVGYGAFQENVLRNKSLRSSFVWREARVEGFPNGQDFWGGVWSRLYDMPGTPERQL